MSTKTLRKRIALVAVSAMGFGVMSVSPASAAVTVLTSMTLSTGQIVAGSSDVTVTTVQTGALAAGISVTTPLGTELTGGTDIAESTGLTVSAITATTTVTTTIAASALREPGTYKVCGVGSAAETTTLDAVSEVSAVAKGATASCAVLTVVSPSTSTTMGISMDASNYTGLATTPVITAWRTLSGTTGAIKLRWDRSPDADLAVGTVAAGTNTGVSDSHNFFSNAQSDIAGTYTATAWIDTNGNDIVDSAEPSASISYLVGSASASTDVITATATKSVADDEDTVTICATATDASGRALVNALQVQLDVDLFDGGTGDLTAATNANMTRQGTSTTYCYNTVVESGAMTADFTDVTFTVSNSGGTATGTVVVRVVLTAGATIPTTAGADIVTLASGDGVGSVTSGVRQTLTATGAVDIGTSAAPIAIDKAVTTQNFTLALATTQAGEYVKVTVAPRAGTSSAVVAGSISYKQVTADGSVKFAVTAVAPAATNGYSVNISGDIATNDIFVQFGTPAAAITVSPTATIKAKYGDSTALTASLADQFGRPMASKVLVYTVSGGRNANVTGTLTTATDGSAAYTLVDKAGTADIVNLTDTVTFTHNFLDADGAGTSVSGTRSVTYSATGVVVGSVTLTPAAITDVTIAQSSNTGATTFVAYTAQVYLSTGLAAGSGVLVTCSAGADDLFLLGVKTAVTGTDGTAACNLYRVKTGSISVKATAGGVSSTPATAVTFVNDPGATAADGTTATGASDARNVAVANTTANAGSAATVVAKVTDRWGNPVAGVLVTWSYTGIGRPVSGADMTVGTDTNGQAQVQMTSLVDETGASSVTATIGSATNQTLDTAGFVGAITSAGAPAGNFVATGTVTFAAPTATVTNADVLKSIVALIASINKQIQALQALILKKK